MNGRILFRVFLALMILASVAAVAVFAYNAGVARGLVESGKLPAPAMGAPGTVPGAVAPYPYGYYPGPFFFHRPFGFGFGLLRCLIPLGLLLLFFAIVRGFFFRQHFMWGHGGGMRSGPWMMGRGPWAKGEGPWGEGAPPFVEEWHRKMHGEGPGGTDQPAEKL